MQKPKVLWDDYAIDFSPEASVEIEALQASDQSKIADDLTACFAQSLEQLMTMQTQGYWSDAQSHMLNMLSGDSFPVSIDRFSLRVEAIFCTKKNTLIWFVHSISSFKYKNVIKLSDMRE